MGRSYHITEKKAFAAFREGDVEPSYQSSEKRWVKQEQIKARKQNNDVTNRSIVSAEITRTRVIRTQGEQLSSIQQTE